MALPSDAIFHNGFWYSPAGVLLAGVKEGGSLLTLVSAEAPSGEVVTKLVKLTQTAYDALGTPATDTLYVIVEG